MGGALWRKSTEVEERGDVSQKLRRAQRARPRPKSADGKECKAVVEPVVTVGQLRRLKEVLIGPASRTPKRR